MDKITSQPTKSIQELNPMASGSASASNSATSSSVAHMVQYSYTSPLSSTSHSRLPPVSNLTRPQIPLFRREVTPSITISEDLEKLIPIAERTLHVAFKIASKPFTDRIQILVNREKERPKLLEELESLKSKLERMSRDSDESKKAIIELQEGLIKRTETNIAKLDESQKELELRKRQLEELRANYEQRKDRVESSVVTREIAQNLNRISDHLTLENRIHAEEQQLEQLTWDEARECYASASDDESASIKERFKSMREEIQKLIEQLKESQMDTREPEVKDGSLEIATSFKRVQQELRTKELLTYRQLRASLQGLQLQNLLNLSDEEKRELKKPEELEKAEELQKKVYLSIHREMSQVYAIKEIPRNKNHLDCFEEQLLQTMEKSDLIDSMIESKAFLIYLKSTIASLQLKRSPNDAIALLLSLQEKEEQLNVIQERDTYRRLYYIQSFSTLSSKEPNEASSQRSYSSLDQMIDEEFQQLETMELKTYKTILRLLEEANFQKDVAKNSSYAKAKNNCPIEELERDDTVLERALVEKERKIRAINNLSEIPEGIDAYDLSATLFNEIRSMASRYRIASNYITLKSAVLSRLQDSRLRARLADQNSSTKET